MKPTRLQIESALDDSCLWAAMKNGRFWKLRRNGKTQTWKTRQQDFRIPVKAGLKSCGEITNASDVGAHTFDNQTWKSCSFVIAPYGIDLNAKT